MQRKILAISSELHASLLQPKDEDEPIPVVEKFNSTMTAVERFEQIHRWALNILEQMDAIPLEILKSSEKYMRAQRKLRQERTADALVKQQRYDLMKCQIENHFSSVARFKRVGVVVADKKK